MKIINQSKNQIDVEVNGKPFSLVSENVHLGPNPLPNPQWDVFEVVGGDERVNSVAWFNSKESAIHFVESADRMRETTVSLDFVDKRFPCIVEDGVAWNGFACPYFTREQAEDVLKSISEVTGAEWEYQERNGWDSRFTFTDPDDEEPSRFMAVNRILADGSVKRFYAVGAWSWVWWDNSLD